MPSDRGAVVVGAGLLGLTAAHALSRRGWRVTVLEAGERVGHDRAGSKGSARIFRLGYPDPLYVRLALEAERLWRSLEAASGRVLLERTGQVTFGHAPALAQIASALHAAGAPAQELSPAEAARRVPSMTLPAGPVLFEPDSGVLHADACLAALHATGDFSVRTGATVVTVDGAPSGRRPAAAVVLSSGERVEADVVVNCAGHRALALAGLHTQVAAPPTLPQVAYFGPRDPGDDAPLPPVFIEWGDDMVYGLPVPVPVPVPVHGLALYKVSHHTPGEAFEGAQPTDAELSAVDAPRLDLLCAAVGRLLPGLDPVPVASERCVYDNSADTDFVLDRVGNVVFGCGTSGHAFKFGPILGVLLADLADGVTPSLDITRFALGRSRPPDATADPVGAAR